VKKLIIENSWWVTFLLALGLLVSHTMKLAEISVDSTSVILLLVMLISPFVQGITKIKYGDFEAEIDPNEVKKIRSQITEAKEPSERPDDTVQSSTSESILELSKSDQIVALAKLRIELEKIITQIADTTNNSSRQPLGRTLRQLTSQDVIPHHIGSPLIEVIGICNRAIHGEAIDEQSAESIVELGVDLLEELYFHYDMMSTLGTVVEETVISSEDVERFRKMRYKLTSVTPLVNDPKLTVRELNQDQIDSVLERYSEYAEFVVALEKIEDDV
jgi:cell fate (sporulation/competence/biofilm development) regulator YlbF (YheA/YmcA/DUF963 family)